jgi:hypothetical protein
MPKIIGTFAEQVRGYLKEYGPATAAQTAKHFGLKSHDCKMPYRLKVMKGVAKNSDGLWAIETPIPDLDYAHTFAGRVREYLKEHGPSTTDQIKKHFSVNRSLGYRLKVMKGVVKNSDGLWEISHA